MVGLTCAGQAALVAVEEGQCRQVGEVRAGLVRGELGVEGGGVVGPSVGGWWVECAGLAGAAGEDGARGVGGVVSGWEVVGQGEDGVGDDEALGGDLEGGAVGRGGLVAEPAGASRGPPGQGFAQA